MVARNRQGLLGSVRRRRRQMEGHPGSRGKCGWSGILPNRTGRQPLLGVGDREEMPRVVQDSSPRLIITKVVGLSAGDERLAMLGLRCGFREIILFAQLAINAARNDSR